MKKLVYGKGYNDGSRPSRLNSKVKTKEYSLWKSMLQRCFSESSLVDHPTYRVCSVSDNFLNYTYFYNWCHQQTGFNKQDWQLDKDILTKGNKIYGEDVCVFVPREINLFFIDNRKARGEYPVGVYLNKASGKYHAQCRDASKIKYLGCFNTAEEAFIIYKPFKENLCKQLALKWKDEVDPRLFEAMMKWEVESN